MQFKALDTIYVLGEGQWFLVQRFPVPSGSIKSIIYNGNLYLSGSMSTCYCKVDLLIAACDLVMFGGSDHGEHSKRSVYIDGGTMQGGRGGHGPPRFQNICFRPPSDFKTRNQPTNQHWSFKHVLQFLKCNLHESFC